MIKKARERLSLDNVTFAVADITQPWPAEDESFDLVVCNLVLEHISDLSFVFAEAFRVLRVGGRFFVSELHPFRQYQGTQAKFQRDQETTQIPAFVHHTSDFIDAGELNKLTLAKMKEWTPKYRQMSEAGDVEARKNLVANKVALIEPTAEDRQRARATVRPMWEAWAKKYGTVGQQLLDGAVKACGAT